MPKVKWDLSEDPEEIEGSFYDGDVPPKGIYVVKLKRLGIKTNKNDDDMFNGLVEIADPRKKKSKYNGYAFWFNRNVTKEGERFLRNFIEKGLGVPWKKFRANGAVTEDGDRPTQVVSIGGIKIAKEPLMVMACKRRKSQDGEEWELTSDDFAPAFPGIDPATLTDSEKDEDEDEDEDEELDDEDEDPFGDEDEEDSDEEDSDEEDEDDSDEEDEGEAEDSLDRAELEKMGLAELRQLAKDVDPPVYKRGQSKPELVELLAGTTTEEPEEEEEPRKPTKRAARAKR